MPELEQVQKAANTALLHCMGAKKHEHILIVVDEPMLELGAIFYREGRRLGLEVMIIQMSMRENHGSEPPKAIAAAMAASDIVLCVTAKSLSHTQARRKANQQGARVASLPALTREMMERTLTANYNWVASLSHEISDILTAGKVATISCPHGTHLTMNLGERLGKPDTGLLHQPGDFGNLPAGEAYIAPVEGSAEGSLVIDGAMSGIGILTEPLTMEVKNGLVVNVSGKDKDKLEAVFDKYGEKARNIAELGIGTNPVAKITGVILEDEKVLGTVHVALGDNSTFGGQVQVDSHLDGIITKPSIAIDGHWIIRNGVMISDSELKQR